jgi:hypothetical protein
MTRKLAEHRRLTLILEPRDAWVGVYWDKSYFYIVLVPCFPLRITRGRICRCGHAAAHHRDPESCHSLVHLPVK